MSLLTLAFLGCTLVTPSDFTARQDFDGDGSAGTQFGGDDCDDNAPAVNPSAAEVCDGIDNDCDGTSDNDDATDAPIWYADADGDGYGGGSVTACQRPEGYVPNADDCNDDNAAVNPSVTDEWYDGVDADCGGNSDYDKDGDGFDSTLGAGTDCNDEDAATNPGATEIWYDGVDQDCDTESDFDQDGDGEDSQDWGGDDCDDEDGSIHPEADDTWYDGVDSNCDNLDDFDQDGDGHANTGSGGDDCDDGDVAIYAGATEYCDTIDQDCDGVEDDSESVDADTFYADADADRYGDADSPQNACSQPVGFVTDSQDCDDSDPSVTYITWFEDSDTDNYGNVLVSATSCTKPVGYVADETDCDDLAVGTNPGELEICDSGDVDEDCNEMADDADAGVTGLGTYYGDYDGDGFGDAANVVTVCDPSARFISDSTDCDDGDEAIRPTATEKCDASDVDEDCDGLVDDDDDSVTGQRTLYVDGDGDGYGAGTAVKMCDVAAGYATGSSDCDDGDATTNPGDGSCTISMGSADATLNGEGSDRVGYSGTIAGDVNADGYDDAWIGSSKGGYVVLGPWAGSLTTASADAHVVGEPGNAVAYAGDVNSDGYDDLWLANYLSSVSGYQAGAAWLILGPVSGSFSTAVADAVLGGAPEDYAGMVLDGGADFDGDGQVDLLVGVPFADTGGANTGAAYVMAGPFSGEVSMGTAVAILYAETSSGMGASGVSHGDLDGDGVVDALVSAYSADGVEAYAGRTYLFAGPVSGSISTSAADASVMGSTEGQYTGWGIAGCGDISGDGYDDILIGVQGGGLGAAYVVYGPLFGDLDIADADARYAGDVNNAGAGYPVAAAGDVDADGYADVLIGARYLGCDAGSFCGGGYLLNGPLSGTYGSADARTFTGTSAYDMVVPLAGGGDVDADGLTDIMFGGSAVNSSAGAAYLFLGSSL